MPRIASRATALLLSSIATLFVACSSSTSRTDASSQPSATSLPAGTPRVGPLHGSVLVVGGGAQGPEVFAKFIELAGGPDVPIVEVPTAGGDSIDISTVGRGLRAAGARNVIVLHTTSKQVANADTFVAKIANARGVWFGGGRHYRLVDSYLGTKTQRAFEAILERGGVAGGSSAGASILGDYLVRGAPSNNNRIMSHPQYLKGFAYLRGVAVDQHVVARERLADLYDSVTTKHPELLAISEDEGTAWVVRGDTAEIIGRNKAFVYNGRDPNDAGRPFLTLHPGDKYNLATRRVMHRAIDETSLTQKAVDQIFAKFMRPNAGRAAIIVAQRGKVYVDAASGTPRNARYMPETAIPNYPLLGLSQLINATVTAGDGARFGQGFARRAIAMGGQQRSQLDSATGMWQSNVDDLYRWHQGRMQLRVNGAPVLDDPRESSVLAADMFDGVRRLSAFGARNGMRNAYVRFPDQQAVIIILTTDDTFNAREAAEKIAAKLPLKM